MNPRKIRTWAGRLLLAAGIVLAAMLGPQGAAQASAASSDSGTATTMSDPSWG